jgi:two-component system response regulator HydG
MFGEIPRPDGARTGQTKPVLHLLVVDEDDSIRESCVQIARSLGFAVVGARDVATARALLNYQKIDVLLLDLRTAGAAGKHASAGLGSGLGLLEEVKRLTPETSVIVMTAFATVPNAVEAMRVGAGDYLTKPFALEELVTILSRAGANGQHDLESRGLRERLRAHKGASPLVGSSPQMEKLYRILSKVASATHPVLIAGEAGTGKELVARSIHFNGPNAALPFMPVDCGSLIPARIAGELFGYAHDTAAAEGEPGHTAKAGLLAMPEGGTVLLDEVGELSLDLQARLLRALQEKLVRPLGADPALEPAPLTARILASSDRDLSQMVEQGRFRKDLYFRLNIVTLRIPPLRERREDIGLLAQYFLDRNQRETGVIHTLSDEALRAMLGYDWPGNVRELENAIAQAITLSSGPVLHMGDLPTQLHEFQRQREIEESGAGGAEDAPASAAPAKIVSIAELEKTAILRTIRDLKGDKLMAAKLLGIGKTTLYRKLKEYGIGEELV